MRVRPDLDGRFRASCASRANLLTGVDDYSRIPEKTKAVADAVPDALHGNDGHRAIFGDRERPPLPQNACSLSCRSWPRRSDRPPAGLCGLQGRTAWAKRSDSSASAIWERRWPAGRLADAGYGLVAYDTRDDAVQPLVARGAKHVHSPAEVGASSETVLVSLPTPEIVRQVVLGPGGIAEGSKVATIVDLSTTGPRVSAAIAAELKGRGITFVDSPVSGGVGGAKAGTLAVMVSGPRGTFERLEPMLKHIGKVFFIGEAPGSAQMMKLCNNLMSATAMAIAAEAITAGVKAGIDPTVMIEVINVSSGQNTATTQKFPKSILNRRFDYGFATGLMFKDVRLCLEEAGEMGLDLETAKAVRSVWQKVNDQFGPESDFTRIVEMIERPAGVVVGKEG